MPTVKTENPMDYHIWGFMQEWVFKVSVRQLVEIWNDFQQSEVNCIMD